MHIIYTLKQRFLNFSNLRKSLGSVQFMVSIKPQVPLPFPSSYLVLNWCCHPQPSLSLHLHSYTHLLCWSGTWHPCAAVMHRCSSAIWHLLGGSMQSDTFGCWLVTCCSFYFLLSFSLTLPWIEQRPKESSSQQMFPFCVSTELFPGHKSSWHWLTNLILACPLTPKATQPFPLC